MEGTSRQQQNNSKGFRVTKGGGLNSSKEEYKQHLYSLIVCGGGGTRLWPRSRQKTPKQFLKNFYKEKTLFTQTVERAGLLTPADKIFVETVDDYVDEALQQGRCLLPKNIITEPFGKNTAMAVGMGAAYILKADPDAIIMNFWSDAAIEQNDLFCRSLSLAAKTAFEGNFLVTVGLKPTFPHTGLGYIETSEKIAKAKSDVLKVNSFKEKPDLPTAQEFVAKGNYFWNTGIYVWSAKAIFEAFSKYSPSIYSLLVEIYQAIGTASEREVIEKAYGQVESLPIDLAVSEKADNLLLVPAEFTWSDIGDWKVTYDLKKKDENGNVIEMFGTNGKHLGVETKNCLVGVKDRLVVTVGVSDLVVIEMDDAILVCQKDKAQDVKKVVNSLKEKGETSYL